MSATPEGWVRDQLLARRVVMLRGTLDDRAAGETAAALLLLGGTGDDPVHLHVDCGDGPLEAAFTIMDTVAQLPVPVHVTCVGRAEGAAVGVVAVGTRRSAAPHARFRLSEPPTEVTGGAADIERWSEHRQGQLGRFVAALARATGRPAEHVEADISVGRWLTADDALAYGLVDELWPSSRGGSRE